MNLFRILLWGARTAWQQSKLATLWLVVFPVWVPTVVQLLLRKRLDQQGLLMEVAGLLCAGVPSAALAWEICQLFPASTQTVQLLTGPFCVIAALLGSGSETLAHLRAKVDPTGLDVLDLGEDEVHRAKLAQQAELLDQFGSAAGILCQFKAVVPLLSRKQLKWYYPRWYRLTKQLEDSEGPVYGWIAVFSDEQAIAEQRSKIEKSLARFKTKVEARWRAVAPLLDAKVEVGALLDAFGRAHGKNWNFEKALSRLAPDDDAYQELSLVAQKVLQLRKIEPKEYWHPVQSTQAERTAYLMEVANLLAEGDKIHFRLQSKCPEIMAKQYVQPVPLSTLLER